MKKFLIKVTDKQTNEVWYMGKGGEMFNKYAGEKIKNIFEFPRYFAAFGYATKKVAKSKITHYEKLSPNRYDREILMMDVLC